jgi:release factor glutamine methyltransferase
VSFRVSGQELSQWRQQAIAALDGTEVSPLEVDRFLRGVSDLDSLSLRLGSFQDQAAIPLRWSWSEVQRRWRQRVEERYPLQYLLESVMWRNFTLKVSPAVLIPRPETESLIDLVLARVNPQEDGHWVDLGTGSGAIAIGLAKVLTNAQIYAIDTSEEALAIARENLLSTGFSERVSLYRGSWWTPLDFLRGQVSGMVSNPPYIPTAELAGLAPEVIAHEPRTALDGGEDGLTAIRHLIDTAPDYLRSGGLWLIEMMAGQGEAIAELLRQNGKYTNIEILPDLAGFDRYAVAHRV